MMSHAPKNDISGRNTEFEDIPDLRCRAMMVGNSDRAIGAGEMWGIPTGESFHVRVGHE
jgi:hypothetical protein